MPGFSSKRHFIARSPFSWLGFEVLFGQHPGLAAEVLIGLSELLLLRTGAPGPATGTARAGSR